MALALVAPNPAAAADAESHWRVVGESRARLEVLDNQFRAGLSGGDQALALRTLVLVAHQAGPVELGVELQDSRHYLDDDGSALTTSQVAAADVLQAYARLDLPASDQAAGRLTLGRQTIDIGSRRQLERVEFANVILSYTGLHAEWRRGGQTVHLVHVAPIAKLPDDFESLRQNRLGTDREQWNRRISALHWISRDTLPNVLPGLQIEAYVYTLDEDDSRRFPTPNRDYVTPGIRLFIAPQPGRWDGEIEAAWRFGERRLTDRADDLRDLRVRARTVHAHVGYTFDAAWRPRIALDFDYASGDRDPNDASFDQYERLFGSRRADLGNTGIYGPLTPANIDAPGFRIEAVPSPRADFRIAWKDARLAAARDAWVVARVRDRSGASGRSIGVATDARFRYWLIPDRLRAEVGASSLALGRFARTAPGATREGDPRYAYAQLTWSF